jgi:proteasome lid subunit RPN8/RPN11
MTMPVLVPEQLLAKSLAILREAGEAHRECVVLWLGVRTSTEVMVREAYLPLQEAADDYFHLPRESIAQLFDVLRERGLMVAAQVHTHPGSAFHSEADDRWAIVRHVGALSLVLPHFARRTTAHSFLRDAAVFRLSNENSWLAVGRGEVDNFVRGVL